jgi:hypothetical protein
MRFQIKGFTSLFLAATFFVMGFSGVILYLIPRGRVANWTGWTMLGLGKPDWQIIHMNFALLFLIAAGLHLYLNWPIFWAYIKNKGSLAINLKLEMLMALLLTFVVLVGTIFHIQPFNKVLDFNYQIKDYWERWAAEAPTPHAEELSVSRFAENLGLSASDVQKALQAEGIVVADTNATIGQVAEANKLTPADVHAAIKKHFPEADQRGKGQGKGRGTGQGKGKGRGMGQGSEE